MEDVLCWAVSREWGGMGRRDQSHWTKAEGTQVSEMGPLLALPEWFLPLGPPSLPPEGF